MPQLRIPPCPTCALSEGRFDDFLHRVSDVGYDTCDTTVTKSSELAGVEEDAEGPFADKDSEAKTSAGVGNFLGLGAVAAVVVVVVVVTETEIRMPWMARALSPVARME